MKLKVIQQFGGYAVGDEITNQATIQGILDSEQAHYVVNVSGEPMPDKDSAEPKSDDVQIKEVLDSEQAHYMIAPPGEAKPDKKAAKK